MRDVAKKTELGFTIAFAESDECRVACQEIAQQYPEFQTEIGVLFLCDNLSKTDIRIDAESDEEIDAQASLIDGQICERNLNPDLAAAAKQGPVNIAIAKKYLETIV